MAFSILFEASCFLLVIVIFLSLFLREMGAMADSTASRSLPQFLDFVAQTAAVALAPGSMPLSDEVRQKWVRLQTHPECSPDFAPDQLEAAWHAVAALLNERQATRLSVYQMTEDSQYPDGLYESHTYGECVNAPKTTLNFLCWSENMSLRVDSLVSKAVRTHDEDDAADADCLF